MGLFQEKRMCIFCGRRVKKPVDGATKCSKCGRPGPWGSQREIESYKHAEVQRQRAEDEAGAARQRAARLAEEREQYEIELFDYERLRLAIDLTPVEAPGFIAKKGEEVFLAMPVQLCEWRKEPGHSEGGAGIRALSFKVPGTKSMRAYYGGLSQPRYVEGAEGWMPIDEGNGLITSDRIVFRGERIFVEWLFDKLVGIDLDEVHSAMVLQVTNRQKTHVLLLEDLGVFYVKFQASFARFQGRPTPTLDPPVPPPELAGESFTPHPADPREIAARLWEDKVEVELERDRNIKRRLTELEVRLRELGAQRVKGADL